MRKILSVMLASLLVLPSQVFAQDDVAATFHALPFGTALALTMLEGQTVTASLVESKSDLVFVQNVHVTGPVSPLLPFKSATVANVPYAAIGRVQVVKMPKRRLTEEAERDSVGRRLVSAIGVGNKVQVITTDNRTLRGTVESYGSEDFRICTSPDCGQSTPLQYSEVSAIGSRWVEGGAKAGLIAGIVGGAILALMAAWGYSHQM